MEEASLQSLATHCTELELLDMSGLTVVDDTLLYSVAANCNKITHISVKSAKFVSNSFMHSPLMGAPKYIKPGH